QAAHSHLQQVFAVRGFILWDNSWYLGRYSFVNYSFVTYLLSYLIGLKTVAAISIASSAGLISSLSDRVFPGSFPGKSRCSLLAISFIVLTGAWPFLLGTTFLLLALFMYQMGKRLWFVAVAVLVLLTSPLALLALMLIVAVAEMPSGLLQGGSGLSDFVRKSFSSFYLLVVIILGGFQLLSMRAFPDHGYYPFWISDLVLVEIFTLVSFLLVPKRHVLAAKLKALIFGYGLINLVAFLFKSNLGSNATRVVDFALPITVALLGMRNFKPRLPAVILIVLAMVWNFSPLSQIFSSSIYNTSNSAYWEKLKPFLARYLVPGSRVELVDTANHQGDYYLPSMGFPIVRGWFRQDDFPQNQLFYSRGSLSKDQYLSWLKRSGASLVVLPAGPYDFSSVKEAQLLMSGDSGLRLLAEVGDTRIFAVPGDPTIVHAPNGSYISAKIGIDSVSFDAPLSGRYSLSLFYSPYFNASSGAICANTIGLTTWIINNPGPNRLVFDFNFRKAISVLMGHTSGSCR
ncbi:MAG: hypothetical protein HKL84_08580, partial [Acidimicrobiaceae bacterium]|nr:hypothetical protein [Acidimicrobiaceae bacterium]